LTRAEALGSASGWASGGSSGGGCILYGQNLYVWFSGGFRRRFLPDPPPNKKIIDYFLSRRLRVGGRVTCETTLILGF
jgi:hypothetical protein